MLQAWNHHFWHAIIFAGILLGILTFGGCCTLIAVLIREVVESGAKANHKISLFLYNFMGSCLMFYRKTAQWVGSLAVMLLILGGLGRFTIFTFLHWREIWGP